MKIFKLLVWFGALFCANISFSQTNTAIVPYVSFLNKQTTSSKDYILDLFKNHDIVILCERNHDEFTQYNLILDVISDKRFINTVGNVFTEIGVSTLNPALNDFLHTKNLSPQEQQQQILNFHRNLWLAAIWERYSYTYLLQSLYTLNNRLPEKDAINLYPSEIPLNWNKVDSTNYKAVIYPLVHNRDSIIAAQVITQFDKINSSSNKRKKALVIMNFRHAFNKSMYTEQGQEIKNVAGFLFKRYGKRVANVYLNAIGFDIKNNYFLLQNGKWDAAFAVTGNKSTGFDLRNTPFGKDYFDYWPYKTDLTYQDMFTGFVFYQPLDSQKLITGIPGFVDTLFFDEFIRRYQLSTILLTNLKPFSSEQIDQYRKNLTDFQKDFNTKRERQYSNLDSLHKTREQWLTHN